MSDSKSSKKKRGVSDSLTKILNSSSSLSSSSKKGDKKDKKDKKEKNEKKMKKLCDTIQQCFDSGLIKVPGSHNGGSKDWNGFPQQLPFIYPCLPQVQPPMGNGSGCYCQCRVCQATLKNDLGCGSSGGNSSCNSNDSDDDDNDNDNEENNKQFYCEVEGVKESALYETKFKPSANGNILLQHPGKYKVFCIFSAVQGNCTWKKEDKTVSTLDIPTLGLITHNFSVRVGKNPVELKLKIENCKIGVTNATTKCIQVDIFKTK